MWGPPAGRVTQSEGGSPLSRAPEASLPCVLSLLDAHWYGSPGPAALAAAMMAKAWYANPAVSGSTPSLYQDDLLEGPVSALLPEPLSQPLNAAAIGAPHSLHAHNGHAAAPDARAAPGGPTWKQQEEAPLPPLPPAAVAVSPDKRAPVPIRGGGGVGGGGADGADEPSSPQAGGKSRQQRLKEQQQQQQQPALGTWAQRQYMLPLPGNGWQQPRGRNGRLSPPQEGDEAAAQQQQQQQQQQLQGAAPTSGVAASAFALATSVAQPIPGMRQPSQPRAPEGAAAAAPDAVAGSSAGAKSAAASDEEEEAFARAAWRWRFTKRWQAEQARQLDPAASAGDGDGMEDLIAYLAACGGTAWDMSRTLSADGLGGSSGSAPNMLGTMGSVGLLGQEQLLVGDFSRNASFTGSPGRRLGSGSAARGGALAAAAAAAAVAGGSANGAGGANGGVNGGVGTAVHGGSSAAVAGAHTSNGRAGGSGGRHGAATRELNAVTRRATQLLKTQSDLDRQAEERWREAQAPAGGGLWVGALLEAVEVDDWGKFSFVLVRLRDRAGRQKLLVRGSNYASQGKLVEVLHRQLVAAAAANDVPSEPLEVVGGGVMEWRRDRDRHLHLHSAYVSPHAAAGPNGQMTPSEVLTLVGVMTKQSLPIHYKVTTDGGRAL